jgi:SulP family sulfate permease
MAAVTTELPHDPALARWIPALAWLRHYQRAWLGPDLIAGVTTATVVIPQAMGYASLAGLPVQVGLYAATVPALAYALFGTSRPLSLSVTSTVSILTAGAIATVATESPAAAAAALSVVVGVTLILAGLLRLGFVAQFISQPVLTGFKVGAGLFIASSQLGKIMGVPLEGDNFFQNLRSALQQLGGINGPTLTLGLVTIALLLALHGRLPRVPGPLIAFVLGILAVSLLDLEADGVAVVGAIPAGLPGIAVPDLGGATALLLPGLGIALMSFVESSSAARAFVRQEEPRIDADRELVALGAASFSAGFFQAYPTSGGLSQTAVNRQAGARTQLASVTTVGVVVLILTVLTPLFESLAEATLGAMVIVAAIGLVDVAAVRRIAAVRRRDVALALLSALAVLVFGVLQGVLTGVLLSMLVLLYQTNTAPVELLGRDPRTGRWRAIARHPDSETVPGVLVVQPSGRLYFANAQHVTDEILALARSTPSPTRLVVLDAGVIPDMEFTALQALADLDRTLRERGAALWLADVRWGPLQMVERAMAVADQPYVPPFDSIDDAVAAYENAGPAQPEKETLP